MRILIAPDKFKGTLTAKQAAEAIASGWRRARPEDQLDLLPMADGGDGFGDIISEQLGAKTQESDTVNAAHEPICARWGWSVSQDTAVVESAKIIGLAMLPPGKFHPFELDTLGLGQLLEQIRAARVIVGIGGSATNDAGFGMARGLGYRFEDASGAPVVHWTELDRLARIQAPARLPGFSQVIIACDVQNRLLGPEGASRIYGPQKGLRPGDFPVADRCFQRLTEVVRKDLAMDCAEEAGTGAAGGLGYGLRAFLRGTFRPGFDIFAEAADLPTRMAKADLIVTGEGALDEQTFMGKGTGAIAKLARTHSKPCIGLAGHLASRDSEKLFTLTLGIAPALTSADEAKRHAASWLEKLGAQAAAVLSRRGALHLQQEEN
jgi:glycerate kinase